MIIQENTIIHGDSLTVLRQMEPESVDAIITDPPYGINYVSQTGASIKNDKSPFIWFLYDAFRVLKSGEAGRGGLICFTRWDVEQTFIDAMKIAGFNVKSEVIWDKVYHGMGDTKAAFAPSHENIVFAIKGKYSFPGSRPKDLVTSTAQTLAATRASASGRWPTALTAPPPKPPGAERRARHELQHTR